MRIIETESMRSKAKTKRGGARPGAGRKPLPDEDRKRQISIHISGAALAALDAAAEGAEVSRSAWIEDRIWEAVES